MWLRGRLSRILVVLIVLFCLLIPGSRVTSSPPAQAGYNLHILTPLVRIYEGDTVLLDYVLIAGSEPGRVIFAPLIPGEALVNTTLGSATVMHWGLNGTIIYEATKAGTDQITVTVDFGTLGSVSGSTRLEVQPKGNFDLTMMVAIEETTDAGGMLNIMAGHGSFALRKGEPITGKGLADYHFTLEAAVDGAFSCVMPPVVGQTTFDIKGERGSYTGRRGSWISLDLNFQPIDLDAPMIHCEGLNGFVMDIPFESPIVGGDINAVYLTGMELPSRGGKWPIDLDTTWGAVFMTRR